MERCARYRHSTQDLLSVNKSDIRKTNGEQTRSHRCSTFHAVCQTNNKKKKKKKRERKRGREGEREFARRNYIVILLCRLSRIHRALATRSILTSLSETSITRYRVVNSGHYIESVYAYSRR
ncbi:hypothetical protein PUN28_002775 [Cardiocondyla obscurior]|uniref:Uncharacterized protein n=1 Tax=Cardiocondyla obscurior TaxID=286306 RepID=A0AAW2GWC5_9HYME